MKCNDSVTFSGCSRAFTMLKTAILAIAVLTLSSCAEIQFASHVFKNSSGETADTTPTQGTFKVGKPYMVEGTTYYPKESYDLVETGIASWYGPGFHGGRTASGEKFDSSELTAAHRTLQMPSLVRVTNLENGRSVIVRVNDRGPFARGRVMDVSSRAADLLGFKGHGTAKVKLEVLPQESLRIAEMAKRGQSTNGMELAANEGPGRMMQPSTNQSANPSAKLIVQPVIAEPLSPPTTIPVHETKDGRFMPDPVVTQMPVHPTSIYVQAGAFSVYDNAERLRKSLSVIGDAKIQQALVNGQQLYRVRVGPIRSVQDADNTLNRIVALGHDKAIIVVD